MRQNAECQSLKLTGEVFNRSPNNFTNRRDDDGKESFPNLRSSNDLTRSFLQAFMEMAKQLNGQGEKQENRSQIREKK